MQTVGFEPTTPQGTDPQSAAFNHSATFTVYTYSLHLQGNPIDLPQFFIAFFFCLCKNTLSLAFQNVIIQQLANNGRQLLMQFEIEEEKFEKLKLLGEGTYGKCYLVLDRTRSELCVLKQVEIMGMTEEEIAEAVREAHILQSLSHNCIVKFLGQFRTKEGYLNILMSYADGGDLSQRIKQMKCKREVFTQSQILHWFTQVCLAIQHVHERRIIHRDIKSQNVFLTKEGHVKLGDFGIARPLQLTLQKIKSFVGTPYYMSPEICDNKEYSLKTDIWSLGVLLLEMCLLKPPFDANSLPALALKISKGEYASVPKFYSKELKKLVSDMMQIDPSKRPNISEVLSSPLLRDRVTIMRYKDDSDSECSQYSLLELSMGNKKSSGASRGLFIDSNLDDYSSIQNAVSPKSQVGHAKHHDMPVKRIDNFTKQSKGDKKSQKRGDLLRRRETSQPNLTPKGHSKIENEKRMMVKNNSQVNFEKKKSVNPTPVCFKKKTKCNQDIAKSLEEINEFKNDIYQLQGQISHREQKVSPLPIDVMEVDELDPDEETSICNETPLQTLEELLKEVTGQNDLTALYQDCEASGGICSPGQGGGLATLAYGLHMLSS